MSYNSQLQKNNFIIHDWRLIDCRTSETDVIAKIDICVLATSIINKLNEIDFNDCDEVILEYQPHLKLRSSKKGLGPQIGGGSVVNSKMKDVSTIIMNYFIMKYIITEGHRMKVRFVSSKNKLTVYDGPYIECKLKSSYAVNKFYSKYYTIHLLRHNQKWLNFFNDFKKKDDLGDSFLQGAWYLMANDKRTTTHKFETQKFETQKFETQKFETQKFETQKFETQNTQEFETQEIDLSVSKKITLKLKTPEKPIKLKLKLISLEENLPSGQEKLALIKTSDVSKKIMGQNNIKKMNLYSTARKPKHVGNYTLNNVYWFIKNNDISNLEKLCKTDMKLINAFNFFFGSLDNFFKLHYQNMQV